MESISIAITETERCPAGLEILQNHSSFTVNLKPQGGVGDFEILNSRQEVVIIGQKHLSTISLLENTSRSEVLTLDLSNLSEISISCPPTEEVALISNTRMGLFQPNTLEITPKERQRGFNFLWESVQSNSTRKVSSSPPPPSKDHTTTPYNFKVINESSIVVAEIYISRLSSRVTVELPGDVSLTPVQAALIFGGLAFQIYSLKKQKSVLALIGVGTILGAVLLLGILYIIIA